MKIKVSFFALMLLLSLIISASYYAVIPIIAAAIHEAGHIICARLRGIHLKSFEVAIFGARLSIGGGIYSYSDEIAICAAGPAINFICADVAAVASRIWEVNNDIFELFILSSLSLGIINLLPIKSFDGGRILSALISKFFDVRIAEKTLNILSFLSLFVIWSISLYLLLRTSASLSLFVFSVSVFASIFIENDSEPF